MSGASRGGRTNARTCGSAFDRRCISSAGSLSSPTATWRPKSRSNVASSSITCAKPLA